jgi:quinohemoprotein ethanol dehydrogenase
MYWKNAQKKAVMYPSTMGSHGWEALAFDPKSNLLFIPAMTIPTEIGMEAGGNTGIYMNFYAGDEPGAKVKPYGEIVAWDPTTQKEVWRTSKTKLPINGGLMHTAGGLVFQGHADGKFAAYDANTGKELWSRQTGGAIRGAASTVMVDGEQFIIIATGNGAASSTASYVARYTGTALSRTPPRLLAFKIGGKAKYPSLGKPEPTPVPPAPRFDKALVKRGEVVFHINSCAACHGAKGAAVGGRVPNLNRMPPADLAMLKTVVQEGALKASGMPQYKDMTDDDAKALFAYIIEEAWESHEEEKRKIIGQPSKQ